MFTAMMDLDQREAMRPKKGDTVKQGDTLYIVDAAGMKYLQCHLVNNPKAKFFLKSECVTKVMLEGAEVEPEPFVTDDSALRFDIRLV